MSAQRWHEAANETQPGTTAGPSKIVTWSHYADPLQLPEPEPVQAWRLTDIIAVVFAAVLALMAVRRIVR